ncbi:MAG: SAM-dependent methyltransferase [Gemmatimonadetes bacterium]|nr:SAM-dependent methyltransferase [Gemmatimonadota bacterium]
MSLGLQRSRRVNLWLHRHLLIGGDISTESDRAFGASVAEIYESHLVPLIFEPYAVELARRMNGFRLSRVLELAAGTGVLTRALANTLPPSVAITATDLNPDMLERAITTGISRPVEWRQADALRLPFGDATHDAVVCQFGVMFFPDKRAAFAEARRVLRPGGQLLFSVWDRIEENEFADTVTAAVAAVFPDDPPSFLRRTPHGYFDGPTIARDLFLGGFTGAVDMQTFPARSRAEWPGAVAVAYCQGTPLRHEIESRDGRGLAAATAVATTAIVRRFGPGPVDGKMQAHIVSVS